MPQISRSTAKATRHTPSKLAGSVAQSDTWMHKLAGRVQRMGDCWIVDGKPDEYVRVFHRHYGQVAAHRLTYAETHPDDDITGHHVHHTCERPGCINPAHLMLLSAEDHGQTHQILREHRKA